MFCQNCGNKIAESAAFCPKCGAKLTTEDTAQQTTKTPLSAVTAKPGEPISPQRESSEAAMLSGDNNLLKALIGKNSDYYLKQFDKIDRGEKSFNWYAFFFAPILLLYRKQFTYFAKMLLPGYALLFIQMLLAGYATATFSLELMTIIPFTGLIIVIYTIVMSILCGKGFNKHYKTQLHTAIAGNQLKRADENTIKKLKPSARIPILFVILYLVLSFALNFVVVNVAANSLLNGYNETATVETVPKQAAHKKLNLTAGEAKELLQTWIDNHKFPASVSITAEDGKRKLDGLESECYMFGLIGLSRTQMILVDSKTGELFINDGRIMPLEEWYQKYIAPYANTNNNKDTGNYIDKNFEWVEKPRANNGNIIGKIKNISNGERRKISVTFLLYDYQGNQIGTAIDINPMLKTGNVWSFTAQVQNAKVTNFEFAEMKYQ